MSPNKIEIIGDCLAIQWPTGEESFVEAKTLRENSPSAENKGESDLFGNISLIRNSKKVSSIALLKFEKVGNYAIRIQFNDGHSSGIYSWDLLKELSD